MRILQPLVLAALSLPLPALAQPRPITVGIEAVDTASDGGTAVFDLHRWLLTHPIQVEGATIDVRIADTIVETDYVLRGDIRDSVQRQPSTRRGHVKLHGWGGALEIVGSVAGPALVGAGFAGEQDSLKRAGFGMLILVPVGFTMQQQATRMQMKADSQFQRSLQADVTLLRNGKKVRTVQLQTSGPFEVPFMEQPEEFRKELFRPLWEQVSSTIAKQVEEDLRATGASK